MYLELFNKRNNFHSKAIKVAELTVGKGNAWVSYCRNPETKEIWMAIKRNDSYLCNHFDRLLLRWPFITIRNSRGDTHQIKDLVVGLPINDNCFSGSIIGYRETLSKVEFDSHYAHSHLSSLSPDNFCTGMDDINDIWAYARTNNYYDDDSPESKESYWRRIDSMFDYINAFVQYESLQGVPYRYMRDIGARVASSLRDGVTRLNIGNILHTLKNHHYNFSIDFNSNKIHVVETDFIHEIMSSISTKTQRRLPNGDYFDLGVDLNDDGNFKSNIFYIDNGVRKEIKIESKKYDNVKETTQRKFCHNEISKRLFKEIEKSGEDQIFKRRISGWKEKRKASKSIIEEKGETGNFRSFKPTNTLRAIKKPEA